MYVEFTGGLQSPILHQLDETDSFARAASGDVSPLAYLGLIFVTFGAAEATGALLLIIVGVVALLALLEQLGLRLLTPKIDPDNLPSQQPEVLYLRNFGDDSLRIRASRLSRRGLLGRLSPWRTRPFEQVVIRRLSFSGYVYAVSPPGARVYGAGVPKAEMSNAGWLSTVEEIAKRALFVAVSATPGQINEGFASEIKMLAERIGHTRIMLIVGPWRTQKLLENWQRFVGTAARYPIFAGAASVFQTPGAHVLVHTPHGWQAWGAASRSEWTYTAAIGLAVESVINVWSVDRGRSPATPTPSFPR